eukprot:4490078-Ditylum_brightwellii.AAC.1
MQIGKGVCIKSQRQQLHHTLTVQQRHQIPKDIGNSFNFYDTIVVGSLTKGYDTIYNFLPHSNKVVKILNRARLAVVQKRQKGNAGYKNNDGVEEDMENNANANSSKKKETASTKSIQLFYQQSDDTL